MVTDVEPTRLRVPTGMDGTAEFTRVGIVELPGLGPPGQGSVGYGSLDIWWLASYGGGLFVPVKDALAGHGTYGGGRYLIDTVKGADLGACSWWTATLPTTPPVRIRPGVGLPAGPAGQRPRG